MRFPLALQAALFTALLGATAAVAQPTEPGAARMDRTRSASAAIDLFGTSGGEGVPLAPPTAPGPAEDPALRLYHLAFQALASGRRTECAELLQHLIATHKDHPLAARAAEILRRMETPESGLLGAARKPPPAPGEGRDGPPTAFSRAELVVAQTLHGVGLGLELCFIADCDDSRAFGAAMVAGGGAGLGLSLLLTGDGITPGHAALLNSGTVWGGATGLFVIGTINPSEARAVPASMMAGQLAGLGVGHLVWRATHASTGDVSLANSGGLWTDFLALMIAMSVSNADIEPEPLFGTLLASTAAGLAGGALLADRFPMSRGRVLIIDGGGLVGALVGVGGALIVQPDEPAAGFLLPAIGAVGGLVLTTFLTRDWDAVDGPDVAFGVSPWKEGAMINASMAW